MLHIHNLYVAAHKFHARTWDGGRGTSVGAPISRYYPAVIDEELWAKAQERRRESTPGRFGRSVVNLFTGIIFDGNNKAPMRLIHWNHTRAAAESFDHGCYLVSDYARLGRAQKGVSWRYGWFEEWFLNCLLSFWRSPECWADTQEKALQKKLVEQHAVSMRLKAELARLVKLARTSDRPPEALLAEMRDLEKEQAAILGKASTLQERLNAIQSQTGAVEDEWDLISKLAHAADQRSGIRVTVASAHSKEGQMHRGVSPRRWSKRFP